MELAGSAMPFSTHLGRELLTSVSSRSQSPGVIPTLPPQFGSRAATLFEVTAIPLGTTFRTVQISFTIQVTDERRQHGVGLRHVDLVHTRGNGVLALNELEVTNEALGLRPVALTEPLEFQDLRPLREPLAEESGGRLLELLRDLDFGRRLH